MQTGRRGAFPGSGAATIASATVLVSASLVVSLGVMWWIEHTLAGAAIGAMVGGICGLMIVFTIEEAAGTVARRTEGGPHQADEEKDESGKGSNV